MRSPSAPTTVRAGERTRGGRGAVVVVWRLRGEERGEERETRAVRLIGVTFFALALFLAVEGIRDLITQARPGQSAAGLALAGAALIVMRVSRWPSAALVARSGNRTLVADSAETAFCAFTSAATLLGIGLSTWLGWWSADPAAARSRHREIAPPQAPPWLRYRTGK